jgi:Ssp1 endopeptidase immunity protein Rap1a
MKLTAEFILADWAIEAQKCPLVPIESPQYSPRVDARMKYSSKLTPLVLTALAALAVLVVSPSSAPGGAVSGNDWRALSESHQLVYVLAVLDGWQVADVAWLKAPEKPQAVQTFTRLANCAAERHMTGGQIRAIVAKYMTEHPATWHEPMAFLVWRALTDVCTDGVP